MSTTSGWGIIVRPLFKHKHTLKVFRTDPAELGRRVPTWTHPTSTFSCRTWSHVTRKQEENMKQRLIHVSCRLSPVFFVCWFYFPEFLSFNPQFLIFIWTVCFKALKETIWFYIISILLTFLHVRLGTFISFYVAFLFYLHIKSPLLFLEQQLFCPLKV